MKDEVKALFIDQNYIEPADYLFRRIDTKGRRNYIKIERNGKASIAPSVTTIMDRTIPMSKYLLDWLIRLGHEGAEWFKKQSACYGTFLHASFADILRGAKIKTDTEYLKSKMELFYNLHREDGFDVREGEKWYEMKGRDMAKDFIGFLQWLEENDVQPLAIEYPVMSPKIIGWYCLETKEKWFAKQTKKKCKKNCIDEEGQCGNCVEIRESAGCIDLVCRMKIKDVEKIALVDFKSGINGFYDNNAIQLVAYAMLWFLQNPAREAELLFNWSPNNFNLPLRANANTYHFEDQTKKISPELWPHLCGIYELNPKNFSYEPKTIIAPQELGRGSDVSNSAVFLVKDEIQEKIEEARIEIEKRKLEAF